MGRWDSLDVGAGGRKGGLAGVLLALLLHVLAPVAAAQTSGPGDDVAIFVASNNWHTEIVLPRAEIPEGMIPELAQLRPSRYLAFGWGDAAYYPERTPGVETAFSAAFAVTPAVLHVVPFDPYPLQFYKGFEVLRVTVTWDGFDKLVRYIDGYFARGADETAPVAADGLYRDSLFFAANGKFHALNTCNTWTARGLMQADLRVGIRRPVYAEEVMSQLRPIAEGVPQRELPEFYPFLPPSAPGKPGAGP